GHLRVRSPRAPRRRALLQGPRTAHPPQLHGRRPRRGGPPQRRKPAWAWLIALQRAPLRRVAALVTPALFTPEPPLRRGRAARHLPRRLRARPPRPRA